MQILVLLGMYFDAVVVFCDQPDTFIQIGSDHTVPETFRNGFKPYCIVKAEWLVLVLMLETHFPCLSV